MAGERNEDGTSSNGTVTVAPGPLGPTATYTYRYGDHVLRVEWDGRDDGDTLYLYTGTWSEPAGVPIDEASRARIHAAFLALGAAPLVDTWYRPARKLR